MDHITFHTGARLVALPVSYILEQCYLRPGDSVLVAGSLIEGHGNPYSDLDVYVLTAQRRRASEVVFSKHHRVIDVSRSVLTPTDEDSPVFLVHTIVPETGFKVDVEFKTYSEIDALIDEVTSIYEYANQSLMLLTKKLTVRDQMFINRVFNSVVVQGEQSVAAIRARLGRSRYAYVCYRWLASDFSVLLDIAGALQKSEFMRAVDLARENVIAQTLALLHLKGVVNPNRKWVSSYLESSDLPRRIKASFADLYMLSGVAGNAGKRAYVARALDFVDDLHDISRELLALNPDVPSGEAGLRLLQQQLGCNHDEGLARLEWQYRARVYAPASESTRTLLDHAANLTP